MYIANDKKHVKKVDRGGGRGVNDIRTDSDEGSRACKINLERGKYNKLEDDCVLTVNVNIINNNRVYCTIIVFMGGGGGNMMFSLYFLYEFKLGVLLVVYIFKISKISKIQFRSSL